jgi:DNA/RNA-binding domain of Phe-tRNA-synthetase-like protein
MKITVTPDVFSRISPDFMCAFILTTHMNNAILHKEAKNLLTDIEEYTRLTFHKDAISTHDLISTWESAKQHFKGKAKHYHTSVEKLLKVVMRGKSVVTKHVALNLVRYMSLRHIVPMTIDDAAKIQGNITVGIASGKERIGLKRVVKGGLIYFDESPRYRVIGSKFGYKKARRTEVNPGTKDILIQIDAMPPVSIKQFEKIVHDTVNLFDSFTDGKVRTLVLNRKKKSGEI